MKETDLGTLFIGIYTLWCLYLMVMCSINAVSTPQSAPYSHIVFYGPEFGKQSHINASRCYILSDTVAPFCCTVNTI